MYNSLHDYIRLHVDDGGSRRVVEPPATLTSRLAHLILPQDSPLYL